jgi:hypothetical protein
MTRTQMAAEMLRRGAPLPSEDTARYSGTILWRQSNRFVNVPGKGYYLIDLMSDAEVKDYRRHVARLTRSHGDLG